MKWLTIILITLMSCNCHGYKCVKSPNLNPKTLLNYWVVKNIKLPKDYKNDTAKKKYELEYKTGKEIAFMFCNKINSCFLIVPDGSFRWNKKDNSYKLKVGLALKY